MKRLILVCVFALCAAPLHAQHVDVVAAVKASLVARGVNLQGECGAFEIVKRVAWQLRGEGLGLVAKTSGANCQGYSTDLVQYANGSAWVDILQDAGGENNPRWDMHTDTTPSMWRPAFDPGDSPTPPPVPIPPPVPPGPIFDPSVVLSRIDWSDQNNERRYQDLAAKAQALAARQAEIAADLKKHDDKPGLLEEIVKSPYLYTILGSILAGRYVIPDGK